MRLLMPVLALVVLTRTSHADDGDASPTVATLLVFGGTTASLPLALGAASVDDSSASATLGVLALGSALVGPSLGRWYARDPAWGGLAMRAGGIGLLVVAARAGGDDESPRYLYAPGLALFATGMILDLARTPGAVRARNRAHVTPVVTPTSAGLAITGVL